MLQLNYWGGPNNGWTPLAKYWGPDPPGSPKIDASACLCTYLRLLQVVFNIERTIKSLTSTAPLGSKSGCTGTHRTTFRIIGEEFAVIRGNLRKLNYTKTVFSQGFVPDPARELTSHIGTQGRHVLPAWIGTSLFRPKLRPCWQPSNVMICISISCVLLSIVLLRRQSLLSGTGTFGRNLENLENIISYSQ